MNKPITPCIVIHRTHLVDAMTRLNKLCNRCGKEVLRQVLIERDAGQSHVTLAATNLDVTLKFWLLDKGAVYNPDLKTHEVDAMRVLLPVELVTKLVKQGSGQDVKLFMHENHVVLSTGSVQAAIDFGCLTEYPPLPMGLDAQKYVFSMEPLVRGMRTALTSTSKTPTRYALDGVLFELHGKESCMVATDGRRLVRVHIDDDVHGDPTNFVVSANMCRWVSELSSARWATDGGVHVYLQKQDPDAADPYTERRIRFVGPNWIVYGSTMDAKFPTWRDVVPRENTCRFTVGRHNFARLVKEVGAGMPDDKVCMVTDWDGVNKALRLSTPGENPVTGEIAIVGEAPDERDLRVVTAFDPAFLLNAAINMDGPAMIVHLHQNAMETKYMQQYPGIFEQADGSVLWVVMPVCAPIYNCPEHLGSNYVVDDDESKDAAAGAA